MNKNIIRTPTNVTFLLSKDFVIFYIIIINNTIYDISNIINKYKKYIIFFTFINLLTLPLNSL